MLNNSFSSDHSSVGEPEYWEEADDLDVESVKECTASTGSESACSILTVLFIVAMVFLQLVA